ncbi:MAG: hypothetical protein H6811_06980 [Phycisphaeraceae bacterium]|nr:hypothetical protein [Phycisphaeraceae bacterium]
MAMSRRFHKTSIAGLSLVFSMPALGQNAVDRVPDNAAAVVAVRNVAEFHRDISRLVTALGVGDAGPLEMIGQFLSLPGMNAEGSAAFAFMPGPDGRLDLENGEQRAIAILPIDDTQAFAEALGGQADGPLMSLNLDGKEFFVKSVGGGFAAFTPDRQGLTAFEGDAGHLQAHGQRLGQIGRSMAAGSDLVMYASVAAFRDQLEQGMEQFSDGVNMMGQMMGDQAQGMTQFAQVIEDLANSMIRDGRSIIVGLNVDESGVTFDLGAQFNETSEMGARLGNGGNATRLLEHVPDLPYLFAVGMDMESPAVRGFFKQMAELSGEMGQQAGMMGFMNISKVIDNLDGQVFMMGDPPAVMMGGLFANTLQVAVSKHPEALYAQSCAMTREMNGLSQGGITFGTSFTEGVSTIENTRIDSWSMRMTPDPENPQGQQIAMAMGMIFGPNMGPGGYYAVTDDTVITTFSPNSELMGRALRAERGASTLATNAIVKRAVARVPEGASMFALVGAGNIARQASNVMAMMGAGFDFDIPADLEPVALSMSTRGGGAQFRLFVPEGVMKMVKTVVEQQMGGMDFDEGPREGNPRF